jgi:hypothetical protein
MHTHLLPNDVMDEIGVDDAMGITATPGLPWAPEEAYTGLSKWWPSENVIRHMIHSFAT